MAGSLMGTKSHGWMDQTVRVAIKFTFGRRRVCFNLAAMSDFWRTRNTWLPTWSTTNVEERSLVM
jgi:hypothetical protein